VADNNGGVSIREVSFAKGADLNKILKQFKDSKEWIEVMFFNP